MEGVLAFPQLITRMPILMAGGVVVIVMVWEGNTFYIDILLVLPIMNREIPTYYQILSIFYNRYSDKRRTCTDTHHHNFSRSINLGNKGQSGCSKVVK